MAWDDAPPTPDELKVSAPAPAPAGAGWDAAPPTPDELKGPSKMESLARGAGNNFPLAPQAIAEGGAMTDAFKGKSTSEKMKLMMNAIISGHLEQPEGAYSKHLEDWKAKAAAAKEANPVSYGAGAVAGTLAPLAIPGVGEALEAAPIMGNAALGAVSAIGDTDLTKDPKKAALDALIGGVVGGGTAGAMEGLKSLGGKVADVLRPAGERIEANATAGALDLNSRGVARMTRGLKNPETAMTDLNDKIQKFFPDLIGSMDTAGSKFDKLLSAHDAAGETIGKIVDQTSQQTGQIGQFAADSFDAIKKLEETAAQYNGLTSTRAQDAQAELLDLAKRMKELQANGQLNFRALADLKTDIGSAYHNPNMDNHGIDQAYGILSDTINKTLDHATVDNPELRPTFDRARQIYKLTSDLLPAMKKGVSKEVAGVGGGLVSAGLGTAAVMGHPGPAAAGYVAKTGAKLLAPDLGQNLAYKFVNSVKGAGGAISDAFPDKAITRGISERLTDIITSRPDILGPGAATLQEAAKRGPNALSVAHFTMMANDDQYRQKALAALEMSGENQ